MADEDDNAAIDPEVELATLNEQRRLMEQLVDSKGWKHLVLLVLNDVRISQETRDSAFLTISFGEQRLDGIQSLVYEGFVKGLHSGLRRVTEIPSRIISNNLDLAKVLQRKIELSKENDNGSSTDGTGDDSNASADFDSDIEPNSSSP